MNGPLDSNNSIKCGLECLFNSQCDFYLYESVNCYLASYEKTDDTTIVLNSSEILSSQELSKSPQTGLYTPHLKWKKYQIIPPGTLNMF